MDPYSAAILAAPAIGTTLFGSGGSVSVPGAMARPTDPTSKFVDEQGMLKEQFRTAGLTNQELDTAKGLLGDLKYRATMEGPSKQAEYLMGAGDLESQAQKEQLQRDIASNRATAEANLAMKGGLSSGARERLAANTATQGVMGGQQINQQNALNRMNTLAQDEAQKFGLLKGLPSQYRQFGQDQLNRQIADRQGGMRLLQDKYKADMQAYGANQMAIAQAQAQNASSKGLLSGLF